MIDAILPAAVASADAFEDPAEVELFPEEEAVVARAVGGRRRAFATARACARRALGELGVAPVAIVPGERGAPRWPAGVVGSITHCDGYRASAVAWSRDVATVGIDAEPDGPLPGGVLSRIASAEEVAHLGALAAADPAVRWDRLLFCAKEATYKAWFPLTQRWLGFHDAVVHVETSGSFDVRLLVEGPVSGFAGRWLAAGGLVITAIAMPAGYQKEADSSVPSSSSSDFV